MKLRVDFSNVVSEKSPEGIALRKGELRRAALAYADAGIAIIPLWGIHKGRCLCPKRGDCQSPGKHPVSPLVPNGEKNATTDRRIIRRWFRAYPLANVGIVLREDFVVLDVDGPEGRQSLEKLDLQLETAQVRTGRGFHFYFRGIGKTKIGFRQGLDFKANGYLVAPPSKHVSGQNYAWVRELSVATPLPRSLSSLLDDEPDASSPSPTRFKLGGRNAGLTRIAGALRRQNLDELDITSILLAANEDLCEPQLQIGEVRAIAKSIVRYPATDLSPSFSDMSKVITRDTKFLWTPRIPLEFLTMLDGKPGLGKSLFLADLAARITTGRELPFSTDRRQGRVLFLSVEDPPEQVMKPRLDKLGANSSKIRYADRPFVLDMNGLNELEAEMREYGPLLVVIDPLFAYLGGNVDAYRANEVMPFMHRLDQISRKYACATVGVRHLTKSPTDDPLYAGIGSVGFIGAVRSALMMVKHPEEKNVVVLAHTKHNLSAEAPAVFMQRFARTTTSPPTIEYLRTEEVSDDFLLRRPTGDVGREPKERRYAETFLYAELHKDPLPSATLFARAEAKSISQKTLRRAFADIGGKVVGHGPAAKWQLPK